MPRGGVLVPGLVRCASADLPAFLLFGKPGIDFRLVPNDAVRTYAPGLRELTALHQAQHMDSAIFDSFFGFQLLETQNLHKSYLANRARGNAARVALGIDFLFWESLPQSD